MVIFGNQYWHFAGSRYLDSILPWAIRETKLVTKESLKPSEALVLITIIHRFAADCIQQSTYPDGFFVRWAFSWSIHTQWPQKLRSDRSAHHRHSI
jgi:hypothetical protein